MVNNYFHIHEKKFLCIKKFKKDRTIKPYFNLLYFVLIDYSKLIISVSQVVFQ